MAKKKAANRAGTRRVSGRGSKRPQLQAGVIDVGLTGLGHSLDDKILELDALIGNVIPADEVRIKNLMKQLDTCSAFCFVACNQTWRPKYTLK